MPTGEPSLRPRAVERPRDAGITLLGVLGSSRPSRLDGGGLITVAGARWSLDWWIGADDRWYLPGREPTVRQIRRGPGPVIETTVRIPSGDARHRAAQVLVGGREATVVEIHNDSPVPVALALALRPYGHEGRVTRVGLALHDRVITVDGEPAVALPRAPSEAGASATDDQVDEVTNGRSLTWPDRWPAAATFPNAVVLYPLPHRTSLRFVVAAPGPGPLPSTAAVPEVDAVVRGWTSMVDAGARFELPDPGLTALVGAARARVLLAADDLGPRLRSLDTGAGTTLCALATAGHRVEVAAAVRALADCFPRRRRAAGPEAAAVVEALFPAAALLDPSGPPPPELMATAVHLAGLAERSAPDDAVVRARRALGRLARLAGDDEAANHLLGPGGAPRPASGSGPAAGGELEQLVEAASATATWGADDGVAPAARFVVAARRTLVDDDVDGELLLAPGHRPAWRGGGIEVHRAPTASGVLSYGVRWHGPRPALLWELDGPGPDRPVTLRCPALDGEWSTTERRGEALLAGSAEPLAAAPGPGDSFS
ncbi:MAG: hypothetical protein ACFCVK_06710 [Acidimicrobiales bacterium]